MYDPLVEWLWSVGTYRIRLLFGISRKDLIVQEWKEVGSFFKTDIEKVRGINKTIDEMIDKLLKELGDLDG